METDTICTILVGTDSRNQVLACHYSIQRNTLGVFYELSPVLS